MLPIVVAIVDTGYFSRFNFSVSYNNEPTLLPHITLVISLASMIS